MAEIPRKVLSEHFQDIMDGRRLVSAVFFTYQFDPGFFEQEALPVFLDIPLSHAPAIKLVQLEDALSSINSGIAVYYDRNGLTPETGSARLDIKRIPVHHRTGIFHAKNVFLLVEDKKPNEDGSRAQTLLVSCLSANLTRAGWWENVEVCHTEEICEHDSTRLRDDILSLLEGLYRRLEEMDEEGHVALRSILKFLQKTDQSDHRTTNRFFKTHFYHGNTSFIDFLKDVAGNSLKDMKFEILSPFFDSEPESSPLYKLLYEFNQGEVRIMLPRKDNGDAQCPEKLYEWVKEQPNVAWGHLPKDILRMGKGEEVKQRFVHAKVYRFFSQRPKREILFIGSVNLTKPAHQKGGNLETGFLVEVDTPRRPDWWLQIDDRKPASFEVHSEDEGTATGGGTRLSIRYWWNTSKAKAFWDDKESSPHLKIEYLETSCFELDSIPSRTWTSLSSDACKELQRILHSTSILNVIGDGKEPKLLLVQEEGMSHRPSLLYDLSPAEILKYWSLLTSEQRAAFLEARAPEAAFSGEDDSLVTYYKLLIEKDTLFDRFAGIFLAFGCLERSVRKSLREGKDREATYRLFGQKYDSLGALFNRIIKDNIKGEGDPIDHYVTMLCARQLITEMRKDYKDYFDKNIDDYKKLIGQLDALGQIKTRIIERNPDQMPEFLEWFEHWFLRRATPVNMEETS
ncbi:hypothetical protein JW926_17125 [Candidatus Sumerlaeota bacterium]|nr:hypothetical protein [Candidatus Sumerlaeota bacterium]